MNSEQDIFFISGLMAAAWDAQETASTDIEEQSWRIVAIMCEEAETVRGLIKRLHFNCIQSAPGSYQRVMHQAKQLLEGTLTRKLAHA